MSRLPPLNALRAFEAAARHLSFLKAAEELHVTPGAVSQQVKALEEQLGVALFRRLPRGVLLTDAGQLYGKRLGDIFEQMHRATAEIRRDREPSGLTVSTMLSFAARWLIPRLGAFNLAHPDITVRVLADGRLTDFAAEDVDLALRYGPGKYAGLHVELLFPEMVFPVCSPALMAGPHPIRTFDDLRYHTLLHDEPDPSYHNLSWQHWLTMQGVHHIDTRAGPRFSYTHMSLQAAIGGLGVALGTDVLADEDLAAGKLVRPFQQGLLSEHSYWLVCPEPALARPRVQAFREWILSPAARF
jgi:LysR family transcriptional regulator, glycine cleavage system transcriptional activator